MKAPRRVAVTTFASNVARIKAVADAARKAEREIVVVGRAMERVIGVARETGYLDGVQPFHGMDIFGHLPPDKVVALCTGSQGEPRAALARIAQDEHPEVALSKGDRVIFSSRPIPGNEKAIGQRHQRPDRPGRRGHHRPHPSGARVRPSAPGRARGHDRLGQAAHRHSGARRGAASVRACRAGAAARRPHADDPQRRSGAARARRSPRSSTRCRRAGIYKDGALLIQAEARTVADRKRLSFSGMISVALAINDKGAAAGRSGDRADRHSGKDRRRRADGRTSPTTPWSRPSTRCRSRAAAIRIRSARRSAAASARRSRSTGGRSRTSPCMS